MKMTKLFLTVLLSAGLVFTSCSSDDDSDSTGGNIVGKWTPTKTIVNVGGENFEEPYTGNEPGCPKDYLEFTSGGALNDVVYFTNAADDCEANADVPTTYTKIDNTLTIAGGDYAGTYEITRLTGSELRARSENTVGGITSVTTVYLSRVSED